VILLFVLNTWPWELFFYFLQIKEKWTAATLWGGSLLIVDSPAMLNPQLINTSKGKKLPHDELQSWGINVMTVSYLLELLSPIQIFYGPLKGYVISLWDLL